MEFEVNILLQEANREIPDQDEVLERLHDGYMSRLQGIPAKPEPEALPTEEPEPSRELVEPEPEEFGAEEFEAEAPPEEEPSSELVEPEPEPEPVPKKEAPKKKRRRGGRKKKKKKKDAE